MKINSIAVAAFATVALSGCGDDQQEIRSWMLSERAKVPQTTMTVAPPKRFDPFRYDPGEVDPFSPTRLMVKGFEAPSAGPRPDLERRREALERFPLESIRMVGHLANGRSSFALLQAETMVYQARVGDYAGQNFGRITRVSEAEVVLKELVRDAAGDWVERNTSLRLQESAK
ncbi:MAG: pilus assembly protein PilP [Burkholderiaceae bacterium]|nr:pilus assembly protein PilP [Burkholderiaceae bacterium]